jgi:hypothetical protein
MGARVGRVVDVRNAVSCNGFAQACADVFVPYSIHTFIDSNASGHVWRQFWANRTRTRDTGSFRHNSCSDRDYVFFLDGAPGTAERDALFLLTVPYYFGLIPHRINDATNRRMPIQSAYEYGFFRRQPAAATSWDKSPRANSSTDHQRCGGNFFVNLSHFDGEPARMRSSLTAAAGERHTIAY